MWPAHVSIRTSSNSSTSRSTTSLSRQPLSYDDRQSWLQEQFNLGLSQLFTGLGEMYVAPHHIHLADNATPYLLCAPRRVPVPLFAKVDGTLGKLESQGVIRWIDEPTEWCVGMVAVPKLNDDVLVCRDFHKAKPQQSRGTQYSALC